MRLNIALSLALLGSVPQSQCILQKRDNSSITALTSDESSFVQWGEAYVLMNVEETKKGYHAHVYEHFGSCFIPGANVGPNDSIYRFQKDVPHIQKCQQLCLEDVRCSFARYMFSSQLCQLLDYSSTPMDTPDADVKMMSGHCDDSCYESGRKHIGEIASMYALDGIHCHNLCIQSSECSHFSFEKFTNKCEFFPANAETVAATTWFSGPGSKCITQLNEDETSCHLNNIKYATNFGTADATDAQGCHMACHDDDRCWSWSFVDGVCQMHNALESVETVYHEGAVAGPKALCNSNESLYRSYYGVNVKVDKAVTLLEVADATFKECEALCSRRRVCAFITHDFETNMCRLYDADAPLPQTATETTTLIAVTKDGHMHPKCSQYNQRMKAEAVSNIQNLNLLQCALSARKNDDISGYLWKDGQCHHLHSASDIQTESVQQPISGVFGTTGLCQEDIEKEEQFCYLDNISIETELKVYSDKQKTPEQCVRQCREYPWCIAAIWQKNKKRCHYIDNIITWREFDNNMLSSRSCDNSCYDHGYELVDATILESERSPDANTCQMYCNARKHCVSFTFKESDHSCIIHSAGGRLVKNEDAISGPRMFCDANHFVVPKEARHPADGWKDLTYFPNISETEEADINTCHKKCEAHAECVGITYSDNSRTCFMKRDFDALIHSDPSNLDTTIFKNRNMDCYFRGYLIDTAVPMESLTYQTASECAAHCMSKETCHAIQYKYEDKVCETYDVAGFFNKYNKNGYNLLGVVGQCH